MASKLALFSSTAIGAAGTPVPAVITGFSALERTLEFTVISTGCTHQNDFTLDHHLTADGYTSVTLLRTQPDRCRRLPFEMTVKFDTPEAIGPGSAMTITNSFTALSKRQADDRK